MAVLSIGISVPSVVFHTPRRTRFAALLPSTSWIGLVAGAVYHNLTHSPGATAETSVSTTIPPSVIATRETARLEPTTCTSKALAAGTELVSRRAMSDGTSPPPRSLSYCNHSVVPITLASVNRRTSGTSVRLTVTVIASL